MNTCSHEDIIFKQAGKSNCNQVMYRFYGEKTERKKRSAQPLLLVAMPVIGEIGIYPARLRGKKTMFNLSTTTIIVHCA